MILIFSRRGAPYTLTAFVALLILVAMLTWGRFFREVTDTVDLPPRGEASYNPLYALKLSLRDAGRHVESRQRLNLEQHPLAPDDTLLLLADPRMLSADERTRLMAWVHDGGHLILSTPPPGVTLQPDVEIPVLTDLSIEVSNKDPVCFGLLAADLKQHDVFCRGRPFWFSDESIERSAETAWLNTSTHSYGFARVPHGEGSVDVVADLDFLQNDMLEEAAHTALARQLLQPNWDADGTFHLIYSANVPPWWKLLVDHGWRAVLALALALLAWLWMRSERMGPLLPSASMDRRSLLEHVQASGEHLFRYGKRGTLYAAVHQAFMQRLRRRDPYIAALEGPAQIDALARRTGMNAADVEAALRYPRGNDRKDFVIRIARLLQLRRRL